MKGDSSIEMPKGEPATPVRLIYALAAITLWGFLIRAAGLTSLPFSADDIASALTATNYLHNGNLGPTMWHHPNLRNLAVYGSMSLFGDGVWGLKAVSMMLGTMTITFVGLLAFRLTKCSKLALLAAFFQSIDSLHIDFSRQAVHELYMGFFSVAAVWCVSVFIDRGRPVWLFFSGVLFGLGVSGKWDVVFILVVTIIFVFVKTVYKRPEDQCCDSSKLASVTFMFCMLVIVPVSIYSATFIPWFYRGYNFYDWIYLHKAMFNEVVTHTGSNPEYLSQLDHIPALWFIKPVGFADMFGTEANHVYVIAISNPLVWLLTLPSFIFLVFQAWKDRCYNLAYLAALFIAIYLPFAIAARPIAMHSACSVLPYAFIMVAYAVIKFSTASRFGKPLVGCYLILTFLVSVPLYALATGNGSRFSMLLPLVMKYRPLSSR